MGGVYGGPWQLESCDEHILEVVGCLLLVLSVEVSQCEDSVEVEMGREECGKAPDGSDGGGYGP